MMNLADRLNKLIQLRQISQEELAFRVGCTQGSITKITTNRSTRSKFLTKIANELQCNSWWLESGEGRSPLDNGENLTIECGIIPHIEWSQVHSYLDNRDAIIRNNKSVLIAIIGNSGVRAYALKVENDSMISTNGGKSFKPGEILVVDPDRKYENDDFVIAFKGGSDKPIFKQVIVDAGSKFLRSLNPQYPSIYLEGDVHIKGVVIAKMDCFI